MNANRGPTNFSVYALILQVGVMQILAALHNQDHILMECSFPADYPNKPFFLRIVSPRMCWYTGTLLHQHSADHGCSCLQTWSA